MRRGRHDRWIANLYPGVFGGEPHKLVTFYYTEGRFIVKGDEDINLPAISDITSFIHSRYLQTPFDMVIIDTFGGGRAILDRLRDMGVPVMAMRELYSKVIEATADGRPKLDLVLEVKDSATMTRTSGVKEI